MLTLKAEEIVKLSEDKQVSYATCYVKSPGEATYYATRKATATAIPGSISYEPSETRSGKFPAPGPKFPLVSKPYYVWREAVSRGHTQYTVENETANGQFLLKRTTYDKGDPKYWTDDVCEVEATFARIDVRTATKLYRSILPISDVELSLIDFYTDIDEVTDQLCSDAAASLYNAADGDFDLLTELAELNKTLGTLAGIAKAFTTKKGLAKLYRSVQRGNRSKSSADGVLLGQYGLMPLYYAAQDAQKAIENLNKRKFRTMKTETVKYSNGGLSASCQVRVTGHVRVSGLSSLRLNLNPLRTGWELIPYSFVVDWVTNIGDTISAYGAAMNPFIKIEGDLGIKKVTKIDFQTNIQGGSSQEESILHNIYRTGPRSQTYVSRRQKVIVQQQGYYRVFRESFQRVILTPEFLQFNFDNNLSPWKAVISAALLIQRSNK